MAIKYFDCEACGGHGKITFKSENWTVEDVVHCPFCAADIADDDPLIDPFDGDDLEDEE